MRNWKSDEPEVCVLFSKMGMESPRICGMLVAYCKKIDISC